MTPYELQARSEIDAWRRQLLAHRSASHDKSGLAAARDQVSGRVRGAWRRVPGRRLGEQFVSRAVGAVHDSITNVALRSLAADQAVAHYRAAGLEVAGIGEIRRYDLGRVEGAMPPVAPRYIMAITVGGATTGAVAGGSAALAAAGIAPAASLTAGTVAADLVGLIGGTARAVAHQGAYYGYDVALPHERAFLYGVLAFGSVRNPSVQRAGLERLQDLSSLLDARSTALKVTPEALSALGATAVNRLVRRLAQRKLPQLVPIAGAVVGGGLNYAYARRVTDAAFWLYRERFLADRYGLHGPTRGLASDDLTGLLPPDEETG